MTNQSMLLPIHVPALRSHIGSWTYYAATMKMSDVAKRVKSAAELYDSNELEDFLQRRLTERSKEIADYLLNQPQRFFNSIVIGVYGGHPDWRELELRTRLENEEELIEDSDGIFGILTLQADTNLWAIDGQHRVSGIKQAVDANPDISNERVAVIFVSGVSSKIRADDEEGYQRTRRLFTVLNKHARPISSKDIIALDEDDVVAIVTRRIVSDFSPFSGRINFSGSGTSISQNDKQSLTLITTLYDVLDVYLRGSTSSAAWKDFKRYRPSEEDIDIYYERSVSLFTSLAENSEELRAYFSNENLPTSAAPYRNDSGGHLIFRPIGILIIIKSIVFHMLENSKNDSDYFESLPNAVRSVMKVEMELSELPWKNLLWDSNNNKMITDSTSRNLAYYLLLHMSGGDMALIKPRGKVNAPYLKEQYGKVLGISPEDVKKVFS